MNQSENDIPLDRFLSLCLESPVEVDDAICIASDETIGANRSHFGDDLVGFEAFVSHVHLTDVIDGGDLSQETLQAAAETLVRCWAVALLPFLKGRAVLFYAGGGSADFWVRFHIERGTAENWLDVANFESRTREPFAVWRFNVDGLTMLRGW